LSICVLKKWWDSQRIWYHAFYSTSKRWVKSPQALRQLQILKPQIKTAWARNLLHKTYKAHELSCNLCTHPSLHCSCAPFNNKRLMPNQKNCQ
jgi:hypothetical protein